MVSTTSEIDVELLLDQLDQSLDLVRALEVDDSELAMVVGPRYDEDLDAWQIAVNVRHQSEDREFSLDVDYSFDDVYAGPFLDEIYPAFVEELEERYGEAELRYTNPKI